MFNLGQIMISIPNASFSTSLLKLLQVVNPARAGKKYLSDRISQSKVGSRFKEVRALGVSARHICMELKFLIAHPKRFGTKFRSKSSPLNLGS